jgi:spore cortex formation protein SpoVR/YcgB (stage V sporulation)
VLKHAWANFRDDSFVAQYLSPHLIRKMRLFQLSDREAESEYQVAAIHDERGYRRVRRALARHYDPGERDPNIQATAANLRGDRRLTLTHALHHDVPLSERDAQASLAYVAQLWGYDVELIGIGSDGERRYQYETSPPTV